MADFRVLRPHIGDRYYGVGEIRTGAPADFRRLVAAGLVVAVAPDAAAAKAEKPLNNKMARPLQNKGE